MNTLLAYTHAGKERRGIGRVGGREGKGRGEREETYTCVRIVNIYLHFASHLCVPSYTTFALLECWGMLPVMWRCDKV